MAASMDPGTAGLGLSLAAEVMWGETTSILLVLPSSMLLIFFVASDLCYKHLTIVSDVSE